MVRRVKKQELPVGYRAMTPQTLYDMGYDRGWSDGWDNLEDAVAKALGISDKSAEEGRDFIQLVKICGRSLKKYAKQQEEKMDQAFARLKRSGLI